ncbi:hypothetical protein BKA62DRAFT_685834 [Auriculariales sp. MPI-PUGE-AT-0066]|nr:hypothetical protein BKA62DRAFT_685834 [Auriculariales sp. MPI-PUGE-AT-0066]
MDFGEDAQATRMRFIQSDSAVLDQLEHDIDSVRHQHILALTSLRAKQAHVDALASQLCVYEQRRSQVQHSLTEVRAAYRRARIQSLPLELVEIIFLELARDPEWAWERLKYSRFDVARTQLPYRLSAVCTSWRDLALRLSPLWSYISDLRREAHGANDTPQVHLRRIELQLKRARTGPLDIRIRWFRDLGDHVQPDTTNLRHLLEALNRRSSQWRWVYWDLPEGVPRAIMDTFRAPLPMLEAVHLSVPSMSMSQFTYFPVAPRLREVNFDGLDMACAPTGVTLPNVTQIKIWDGGSFLQLFHWLNRCATTVNHLTVAFSAAFEVPSDVQLPIVLPNLTHFVPLIRIPPINIMTAPRLTFLGLDDDSLSRVPDAFLEQIAPTTTSLAISIAYAPPQSELDFRHSLIAVASKLFNVTCLQFLSFNAQTVVIPESFIEDMADHDPPLMPGLEQMLCSRDARFETWDGEKLVHLVQKRRLKRMVGDVEVSPLSKVELLHEDTPEWLLQTVRGLLSPD